MRALQRDSLRLRNRQRPTCAAHPQGTEEQTAPLRPPTASADPLPPGSRSHKRRIAHRTIARRTYAGSSWRAADPDTERRAEHHPLQHPTADQDAPPNPSTTGATPVHPVGRAPALPRPIESSAQGTKSSDSPPSHPGREASVQEGHLFRLAGELPPEPALPDSEIRPGLDRLLQGLGDSVPVTVHDGRLDVLARNAAATEHLGEAAATGRYGRNIVYQGFTASARRVLGNEGANLYARWATAELRSAIGRYPDDERLRGLVAELSATSGDFRRHWAHGEVATERSGVKRLRHPTRGRLTFQSEMPHDTVRDHWIVIYAPATWPEAPRTHASFSNISVAPSTAGS
ncbi:MmyB family transcriptional regulator [Streptomyces malaysiensis]